MNIKINGKSMAIDKEINLLEFINARSLDKEKIVVEKNLEIINQKDFEKTLIQDGDSIEIISFVSGG